MELRDYQKQLVNDTYSLIRKGFYRIMVNCPTGGGKTLYIAQIVQHSLEKGKKVLIVAHRRKLVDQLKDTIEAFTGHKSALICPNVAKDYLNPIQIAMAQTLANRLKAHNFPLNMDVIIFDEAHVTSYFEVFKLCLQYYCREVLALSKKVILGMTATPYRTKNKEGFCNYYQAAVSAPSTRSLIHQNYLTSERVFMYDILDTTELKVKDGDYTVDDLRKICNEEYNQDVFLKWKDKCSDRKTIVFCTTVEQAKNTAQLFLDDGYSAGCITGKDSQDTRNQLYLEFAAGKLQILVSVLTLTEGFDEPSIECVVIARPSRSPALVFQMVGRGLRKHPDKEDCYILDFGNCFANMQKYGIKGKQYDDFFDIDSVRLCPQNKNKPKDVETKQCSSCKEEIPKISRVCPFCGHKFTSKAKSKPSNIIFPELIELLNDAKIKDFKEVRKTMHHLFTKNQNPARVFAILTKQIGRLPPNEYFFGAVFNYEFTPLNMNIYYFYLDQFNLADVMVNKLIDLEFGKLGQSRTLPNGIKYTRNLKPLKNFTPYHLFLSDPMELSYQVLVRQNLNNPSTLKSINYCYDYCKQNF